MSALDIRDKVLDAVADLPGPDAATLLYRLAYELRTGRMASAFAPARQPKPPRQPAGCPSESAYRRHLKNGEPVDEACRQHMRDLDKAWRRRQGLGTRRPR